MNAINRIVQLKLNRSLSRNDSHSNKKSGRASNIDTVNDLSKYQETSNANNIKEREDSANNLNSSCISKSNLERFETRLKTKSS